LRDDIASRRGAALRRRTPFVQRHGGGPASFPALHRLLVETRTRGYAVEHGEVTPGFSLVAAAVTDHQ
jgi:DNA-binding IclR family transcriptional regulator